MLKTSCLTRVLEDELVETTVGGLNYSIIKKLDTQSLRDMSHLIYRVRQVERLKAEKARANKGKNERVAYVDMEGSELMSDVAYDHAGKNEVDVAELKPSPSNVCKLLTPANGKNHVELKKSDKFPKKTYTFDVTKCDKSFNLVVTDGQVLVTPGAKVSPLEKRKKRGFCKYHNFLGYKTSQCFLRVYHNVFLGYNTFNHLYIQSLFFICISIFIYILVIITFKLCSNFSYCFQNHTF